MKYLFKPLPEETDKTASNRVRSLEELCSIWEDFSKKVGKKEMNTSDLKKRVIIAVVSFVLAVLYAFVNAIWINLFLTIIVVLLPGILLHPAVNKVIFKNGMKKMDVPVIEAEVEKKVDEPVSDVKVEEEKDANEEKQENIVQKDENDIKDTQ